jgi:hypothetical protein
MRHWVPGTGKKKRELLLAGVAGGTRRWYTVQRRKDDFLNEIRDVKARQASPFLAPIGGNYLSISDAYLTAAILVPHLVPHSDACRTLKIIARGEATDGAL